ncbi:hypothetical protein CVT25_013363 [Psilocybe cyanescens]|uniref:Uncharacterized protein n=1 Tax=Psilocybe cyanescens TaxID=93625 RepID=A0A409XT39_PSICY|nr:hypothetical protein CVT25_013363 [Psilocybe cyanescens]
MIGMFTVCTALSGWFMWRNISQATVMVIALPRSTFCRITPKDTPTLFAFWIPVIGFESLLCLLALLAGLHTFMKDDFYFRHSGKLIKILLRDSIAYFIV